jgi:hypothetical protein
MQPLTKGSDEEWKGTDISRRLERLQIGPRMQPKLTGLDRSREIRLEYQRVRRLNVAFTARERLQPSEEAVPFTRRTSSRIRTTGQGASMPGPLKGPRRDSPKRFRALCVSFVGVILRTSSASCTSRLFPRPVYTSWVAAIPAAKGCLSPFSAF